MTKKHKAILAAAVLLAACDKPDTPYYGKGGENAAQYIREQYPSIAHNARSVRAVARDTVLSVTRLSLDMARFAICKADFTAGKISARRYQEMLEEKMQEINDVRLSWDLGGDSNDSLMRLEKYRHGWQVAYTVEAKMKGGLKMTFRVLMENNGTTPYMTGDKVDKEIHRYADEAGKAYQTLYGIQQLKGL